MFTAIWRMLRLRWRLRFIVVACLCLTCVTERESSLTFSCAYIKENDAVLGCLASEPASKLLPNQLCASERSVHKPMHTNRADQ